MTGTPRWRAKSLTMLFMRSEILREQGGLCCWCRLMIPNGKATLEHLVPQSQGGKANRGNVAVACRDCNETRGTGAGWPDTTRFGSTRVEALLALAKAAESRLVAKRTQQGEAP